MDNQRCLIKGECDNNYKKDTRMGVNLIYFHMQIKKKEDEFMCINMQ